MALTKDELITLANNTFYDNNEGGIEPVAHRNFIHKLLESVVVATVWLPIGHDAEPELFIDTPLEYCDMGDFILIRGAVRLDGVQIASVFTEDGLPDTQEALNAVNFTTSNVKTVSIYIASDNLYFKGSEKLDDDEPIIVNAFLIKK